MSDASDGLTGLVRDCTMSGIQRRVLLLRFDRLPPAAARPHHLRLARAALETLTGADRARLHETPGGAVAVSWRGEAGAALRTTLSALERLWAGTVDILDWVALLTLPRDGALLLQHLHPPVAEPPPTPPDTMLPLLATGLAAIEDALAQVDVSRFMRWRPVCAWADGGLHLAWHRRVLSIEELFATLAPGCSPRADPWLFLRLTRTLDRRVLALLTHPSELVDACPFSLTLNVASVVGPEFMRFDAALPSRLRGEVRLELSAPDILADMPAFIFAREFARARGYRLILRGIDPTLPQVAPDALDLDLHQVRWSSGLPRATGLPPAPQTVLSRADHADAIAWGAAHGIRLFEGRAALPGA